ncbi:hypothetical protein FEF65_10075 [Mariprofundus erugo]|uniref:Uncharacterized protein n=1 Tax=Mariprofundus erugo TaxID=2528639 RepID=A0A5R9GTB2_9PROT|nr:hypothetical protein [Mariprofundus erugo]TLS66504.1 hypothetical protein FEF65_10075 [Mariprofundus erugo]
MKSIPPKSLLDDYKESPSDKVLSALVQREEAKDAWRRLAEICSDELYEEVAYHCYCCASVWVELNPADFSDSLSKKEALQLAKSLRLISGKLSDKSADANMIHLLTETEKMDVLSNRKDAEGYAFLSGMNWNFEGFPTDEDLEVLNKDHAFTEWKKKQAFSRPMPCELDIPDYCQNLLPANVTLSELMIRHAEGLESYSERKKRTYRHEDEVRTTVIRELHSAMMVYFDQPHHAIVCGLATAVLNDKDLDEVTVRGCVRKMSYPYWSGIKVRRHKSDEK